MFVNPNAMPSCCARLRCVTRESCSTASSSFKSRCASMSISSLLTGPPCDRLREMTFHFRPVVGVVDAEAARMAHDVRDRVRAEQARFGIAQRSGAKQVDGAVHRPHRREVLAALVAAPDRLAADEQRRRAIAVDVKGAKGVIVLRYLSDADH